MANPTTTPETLEQVLTTDLMTSVKRVIREREVARDTGGALDFISGIDAAREMITIALAPYLEAREQAIREDERRKVLHSATCAVCGEMGQARFSG